ncbi:MAG: hypothetical protein A3J40_05585 [Erythrobacter sp. RIFCSPHIGHO2_12_FULL_63_10]|nr:MAG: hypothetical protein A3J40_05585 [Erythrobacter sp. RIFCSPHIGHO2_12_FULL_63_10]
MAWIASRALLWESPFALATAPDRIDFSPLASAQGAENSAIDVATVKAYGRDDPARLAPPAAFLTGQMGAASIAPPAWSSTPLAWSANAAGELVPNPDIAGGHQILWMAAMAHLPVPRALNEQIVTGAAPDRARPAAMPRRDRWSLEAWAFLRDGSGSAQIAQGRVPSYGASQAAAVLNYRIAPQSARDPRAYARAYKALIDGGEKELAAGLSARPLAALPLRAHAELRASSRSGKVDVRPAVFITSEFAPLALPLQMRAEAYVQAGYVGGDDATGFADGQVHVLRDVGQFDLGQVSIGAGAWGGAQEGAERIDIGPSLRFDVKLDKVPARLALDYRERVAGNAEPASGAALTLSTRF